MSRDIELNYKKNLKGKEGRGYFVENNTEYGVLVRS